MFPRSVFVGFVGYFFPFILTFIISFHFLPYKYTAFSVPTTPLLRYDPILPRDYEGTYLDNLLILLAMCKAGLQ